MFTELTLEARSSVGFTCGSLKAPQGLQYYACRCGQVFIELCLISSKEALIFAPEVADGAKPACTCLTSRYAVDDGV